MKKIMSAVLCTSLVMLPMSAMALKINASGSAKLESHDNILRTSDNEESDVMRIVGLDLSAEHEGNRIKLDTGYTAEYTDYSKDRLEDTTEVNGKTILVWNLISESLNFTLDHQVSEKVVDDRQADLTDNRERRSIISAGFDWNLRVSKVDRIVIRPQYIDISFDDLDESDSERETLGVDWQRKLNPTTTLALRTNFTDVSFDDSADDYEQTSIFLQLDTTLSRISYQIAVGSTESERDEADDEVDATLLRFGANYLQDDFNAGIVAVQELTDTSFGLSGLELSFDDFDSQDGNFGDVNIVERKQIQAYVSKKFGAAATLGASLSLGEEQTEDDAVVSLNDNDNLILTLDYDYVINPTWSLFAFARFEEKDFIDSPTGLEYEETEYVLGVDYILGPKAVLKAAISQESRETNNNPALEFDDNFASIEVNVAF